MRAAVTLVDMHCHLDLMSNARDVAREAAERGIGIFCTTVTPKDAEAARELLSPFALVRMGTGLHPWWLADGTCTEADVELIERLAARERFIGEVGLDASKRGAGSFALQQDAFRRIARAAASAPVAGRVLSIHAIRSADAALDILEETGLASTATCIFHWFSGSTDELWRAVRAGCSFSINEHMLATKRGREYARILPEDRLLLETDAPPKLHEPYALDEVASSLERAACTLASIRGCDRDALKQAIAQRSRELLGL